MENTLYTVHEFVIVKAGQPFRLFPFGTITKGGESHELTPEKARSVKLPHFKPPIKLGSHADDTPAGGFIADLEVVEDNRYGQGPGLYALPEWVESGLRALANGSFRYHSPEIIWDGWTEDATTGERVEGTIIMGAALLHTPALGEAAAFFSATTNYHSGGDPMSDTVTVEKSLYERMVGRLFDDEPEPTPPQRGKSEEYAALKERVEGFEAQLAETAAERDEYAARLEAIEAERKQKDRVAAFATDFADTPLADDGELHEALTALDDSVADVIVARFRALAKQVDASLERDVGAADGDGKGNLEAFEAAVRNVMAENGVSRSDAYQRVIRQQPELYEEAING